MKKTYSIQRFLTLHILAWTLVMTVVPAIWVYHDTAHEVEELFDASLAQSGRVLHGMINRHVLEDKHPHIFGSLMSKESMFDNNHHYEKKVSFQIIDQTGVLLHSASAPEKQVMTPEEGYHYLTIDGYEWRFFALYSEPDQWWLMVGERMDIRDELTHKIALDHALPLFLLIPLLILVVGFVIRKGLLPLTVIAKDVEEQGHSNLKTLHYETEPVEVQSLIHSINDLFERLNTQYERERRFSSDAAHELRTPLAGLKLHTEIAIDDNQDPALDGVLINLKHGISRLSHLIAQLLSLSRADAQLIEADFETQDINALLQKVVRDCGHEAETKSQQVTLGLPDETLKIKGNEALLHNMFSNVLFNAIKYTPEQGQIAVNVKDGGVISIEDSGPGIAPEEYERVRDRFYRIADGVHEGSGLGLAIVERIAEVHGLRWELSRSELGGLKVSFWC